MLRHCIAASCNSIGGKGCSLTMFLKDEVITKKWIWKNTIRIRDIIRWPRDVIWMLQSLYRGQWSYVFTFTAN